MASGSSAERSRGSTGSPRRSESARLRRSSSGARREELGHILQREAVLRTQRQEHGVVAGRGLQLEIEGGAEALAQRQAERAVEPRAERRMHHQLHATGVVEEALENDGVLRR